jgi:protein-arginine kinase activator protein McsA
MTSPTFPELPAGLRARLDAAGVTDAATLAAALDADPELRREYQAFLLDALPAIPDEEQLRALWQMIPSKDEDAFLAAAEARAAAAETSGDAGLAAALRERIDALRSFQQDIARDGEILRQALERLEAAATDDDLAAVWRDVPLELEETFLNLVALQAEEHEQHGDAERAAHVRACHERFSAIQQQQRAGAETMRRLLEQLAADVEALAAAADHQGVADVWNRIPLELEEPFLQLTEHLAGELEQTDAATAARLRELIALLRQLREAHQALQEAPPAARALLAFLQAASDADATRVFNDYKEILQPFEAQRELDDLAQQAPDEQRAAIAARAALLRRLRGGDPAPRPTPAAVTPAETRRGTPGSIVYINSAVVEGGSGTAIVYNNIVMERRWLRPRPERLSIDAIARTRDLEQVARIITERGQLAITGGTRTATAAVQGMPGIGKTILARQLALALDDRYPGGVIWEEIGPEVRAPEDTQPILNRWARYALTVPPNLDNQLAFDAGAVRALFAAQGQPLLVILDNVWSLEAIRWLRAALPENAHLVITTRLETVMIGLGGGEYVLGLLTPDEARALIALRLNWTELPADHYDWADALAAGVGYHTLALDVAIRRLRLDARSPGTPRWREQVNRLLDHIRSGQGFERLALPDSERNQNVEAVLAYSYDRMDDTARARFRMLGAFAPEATFGSAAVAALWQCDVEPADEMLSAFAGAALLEAGGDDDRWRQHGLLRGYALALLRREGEHEAAAARHAVFYAAAMRAADDAQRFYEVLGDYAQLRHAFAWAIENDLELALDLVANTANLQKAHGYGRDNLAWAEQALAAAQQRGTPAQIARAQVSLGNALQHAAGLPGEDRGARLRQALSAYDEALRFYTPTSAPLAYATTQNNRGAVLQDLATLAEEDRAARLRQALSAYDEALRFYTPTSAPLDYAMTQNNRGNVLQDLATLAEEDRAARLRQALSAYDEALRFYTPTSAPLDYAMTQNNRGAVLRALATLAEEDRAARLRQALSAYDEALRFYTPTSAPLDYAMTQGNLLNLYQTLAGEPGEDRMSRLLDALRAGWTAFRFFTALQHSDFQQRVMRLLRGLRAACSDDFATLWASLDVGPPPEWLTTSEEGETLSLLSRLIQRLLAVSSDEELLAFWRELPAELEEPLAAAAEEAARQSGQAGDVALAQALRELAAGLRAIRAAADAAQSKIQQAWQHYIELVEAAEAAGNDIAAWRAAVEAGEALLAPEFADTLGVDWEVVRASLASSYTSLCIAYEEVGDLEASLAATDRAIALQPDEAMWRRNRVGTLIDLGRRAEAAEELARARALEPDAARLTELEARLRDEG